MAIGADGTIFFAAYDHEWDEALYSVRPDGTVWTAFGGGERNTGDGLPPQSATIDSIYQVAAKSANEVMIAAYDRIRTISPGASSKAGELLVPSETGDEVYVFDRSGRHLQTLDAVVGSPLLTFAYDTAGRVVSVTDRDGKTTTIERSADGSPTAVVSPYGHRNDLIMSNGRLAGLTCPLGNTLSYEYTGGRLTKRTDRRGNSSVFTYDSSGRLTSDTSRSGGKSTLSRREKTSGYEVTYTTAEGRATKYDYTFLGNGFYQLSVTDPAGIKTTGTYDSKGGSAVVHGDGTKVAAETSIDPRWGTWVSYVASTTVTTPSGLTSRAQMSREVTLKDPSDPVVVGSLVETTTINGRTSVHSYDGSTRTVTNTSPAGRKATYNLDDHGRVISQQDDDMTPIQFSYDADGNLTRMEQGDQFVAFGYDTLGRVSTVSDASGRSRAYHYNGADLVTGVELPNGATYGIGYDTGGNITQITAPNGSVHSMDYTKDDELEVYASPSGPKVQKSYDADGKPKQITLGSGRSLDVAYDLAGRPTQLTSAEGATVYGWNTQSGMLGQVTRTPATGQPQTLELAFDGELMTRQTQTGAANGTFTYRYGDDFLPSQVALDGANTIDLVRDKDGSTTGYGPFALTLGGPGGSVDKLSGGTASIGYTYDTHAELKSRSLTVGGTPVLGIALTRTNTGLVSERAETAAGTTTDFGYTYDTNGQLVSVTKDGLPAERYRYDINGNRVEAWRSGQTTRAAAYDSDDRMVGAEVIYDSDGFLIKRDALALQYNSDGQLVSATQGSGTPITYSYDGLGRRTARTDTAGTYQYLYGNPSNKFEVTATRAPNGTLTMYYYDPRGHLFALKRGTAWSYVACDQVGSPRVITNAAGQTVRAIEYTAFGETVSDTAPGFDLAVGFAGGLPDSATGLVHFGNREYDPVTGRWTSRDPILFGGGLSSLYGYVHNDPVNFIDPTGLFEPTTRTPQGSTISCDGNGNVKTQLSEPAKKLDKTKKDCRQKHENSHKKDAGGVCKGKPPGQVEYSSSEEEASSEGKAYAAERDCLNEAAKAEKDPAKKQDLQEEAQGKDILRQLYEKFGSRTLDVLRENGVSIPD